MQVSHPQQYWYLVLDNSLLWGLSYRISRSIPGLYQLHTRRPPPRQLLPPKTCVDAASAPQGQLPGWELLV